MGRARSRPRPLLLIVDLFFTWHRVAVEIAGVVDAEATSSGWHGWGWLAGALAAAVVAAAFMRHGEMTLAVLAVGLLLATILAVVTGEASVEQAGVVGLEVGRTGWAAWVGLVLAATTVLAALVRLYADRWWEPRGHVAAWHPTA